VLRQHENFPKNMPKQDKLTFSNSIYSPKFGAD
jgi:hypothetical protein